MKKMSRIKLSGALALGIAIFYGGTAVADSISFGGTFPDSPEVVAATPDISGFGDDANVSLAQTFTVTNAFSAQAIYLAYENDANANVDWNMTVTMFAVTDVSAAVLAPDGTNLYSGTFTFPAVGGADTIVRIDLDTPVALSPGGYAVQITEASGGDFNPGWEWLRPTSDVYPGGVMYEDGNIKTDGARDLSLAVDVAPPLTANDDEYILPYSVSSTNVAAPGVLANDLSYDSIVLVSNISSGSLTFNSDGSFECSGLADGTNTFSYAVVGGSVTSAPATVLLFATLSTDAPVAVDDSYSMDLALASQISGNVLNNDTNMTAVLDLFALEVDTSSANGTVTLESNGSFIYAPSGDIGTNTFTYRAYTVAATSEVATVTLIVEDSSGLNTLIDSFETYDNSANVDVTAIPAALANWNPGGSGQIEIRDGGASGQFMKFGWSSARYRGAMSTSDLFSGVPDSSTEYWLYAELYSTSATIDGGFGLTANPAFSVSTPERGDYAAGVRFNGDGSGTLDLYAFTGGTSSNDVLLTSDVAVNRWHGIWLNINAAAKTYDVYLGEAGDASNLGTQIGTDIAFEASASLINILVSATATAYIDNIIEVDPVSFIDNKPANLYGTSPAAFGTLKLSIGLNDKANPADYWPVSADDLVHGEWLPVAHSDAPDGTFAISGLDVAAGDETNKVIYIQTTKSAEFFRIYNQ